MIGVNRQLVLVLKQPHNSSYRVRSSQVSSNSTSVRVKYKDLCCSRGPIDKLGGPGLLSACSGPLARSMHLPDAASGCQAYLLYELCLLIVWRMQLLGTQHSTC
jgi:hypothetical protein